MAGLKYSPLQHFFRGDATLLLLNSRSSPSHMKLPIAMPLLQTSIHSFLKINQSQSNFHFLWMFGPKMSTNQWQVRVFPGKKTSKRQTAVIGAAYMVTLHVLIGPSEDMVKNGKGL